MLVGGAWWLFEWEQTNGATVGEARTAALNLFVAVEAFYLFSCRSLTHSVLAHRPVLQPLDHRRHHHPGARPTRHHLPAVHEHRVPDRAHRRRRMAPHRGHRRCRNSGGRDRQTGPARPRLNRSLQRFDDPFDSRSIPTWASASTTKSRYRSSSTGRCRGHAAGLIRQTERSRAHHGGPRDRDPTGPPHRVRRFGPRRTRDRRRGRGAARWPDRASHRPQRPGDGAPGARSSSPSSAGRHVQLRQLGARTWRSRCSDLEPGDEIITSPVTFSTDIAPMVRAGLVPAFVDVTADTFQIDVDAIEAMIGPRTTGDPGAEPHRQRSRLGRASAGSRTPTTSGSSRTPATPSALTLRAPRRVPGPTSA